MITSGRHVTFWDELTTKAELTDFLNMLYNGNWATIINGRHVTFLDELTTKAEFTDFIPEHALQWAAPSDISHSLRNH